MPITTTAEVKTLLQISGTDYDTLIDTLITSVQYLVVTNINSFKNPNVWMQSGNLTFNKSAKTIVDSESQFLENDFTDGLDIIVKGSLHNDGIYQIATSSGATAGTLTLLTSPPFDENSGKNTLIQAIQFPPDIKMAVADFIAHKLNKDRLTKSFSLGDYSVTNFTNAEVMNEFRKWRDANVGN